MKAAISNSLFPAFGSIMHNVGFRYSDNVFHEPHFMCGLIGPMSIGKGSINPIIETIIQPLREHDAQSNAKLNEWKRQCKTTAAEDLVRLPLPICLLPALWSTPVLCL